MHSWREMLLVGRAVPWLSAAAHATQRLVQSFTWQRYEDGIDGLTLTFVDAQIEVGFARRHKEQLEVRVAYAVAISIVSLAFMLGMQSKLWNTDQYATPEAYRLGMWQAGIYTSAVAAFAIAGMFARMLARRGRLGTLGLEVVVVIMSTICLACTVAAPKHYITRFFGHDDPASVWGMSLGGTDAGVLLYIDMGVTMLHLMMPIRWVILIPMELAAVPMYAMPAFMLGSPDPRLVPANVGGLTILVALAAAGKRALEYQERRQFTNFIAEKQMRFAAEFQLSQTRVEQPPPPEEERSNAPPTTSTGAFEGDAGNSVSLEKIRSIGLKELWLIGSEEVRMMPDRILGEGGFGVVVAGLYQGIPVAIKAPRAGAAHVRGGHHSSGSTFAELCNELRVLRRLRHPNIVFLYGAVLSKSGDHLGLILELVDGSPLGPFVLGADGPAMGGAGGDLGHGLRLRLVVGIACALRYLHSRDPVIVHGDLKDSNVFVEHWRDAPRAKLLDFGLSRLVKRNAKPLGGTLRWMAPEVFSGRDRFPHKAADVFSFGNLMFFVVTSRFPLEGYRGRKLLSRLQRRSRSSALRWPVNAEGLVARCRPVVEQCAQAAAELRPLMQDVFDTLESFAGEFPISAAATEGQKLPRMTAGASGCPSAKEEQLGELLRLGIQEVHPPTCTNLSLRSTSKPAGDPSYRLAPVPEDTPMTAAPVSSGTHLVYPPLPPTPQPTRLTSTIFLLLQWNHEVASGSCCWLHNALRSLESVQRHLASKACCDFQQDHAIKGYCLSCKLLVPADDDASGNICGFCGGDVEQWHQSSSAG